MAQYQKGPAYKYNPYGNEIVQYGGPDVLKVSDIINQKGGIVGFGRPRKMVTISGDLELPSAYCMRP